MVEDMDAPEREEILSALDRSDVHDRTVADLSEYSASRLMRSGVGPRTWTVGETIDFLRREEWLPDQFYRHSGRSAPPSDQLTLRQSFWRRAAVALHDITEDSFHVPFQSYKTKATLRMPSTISPDFRPRGR
ncbi:MAG: hypothetical protein U1E55_10565 [Paracoccus sp. (in: a-proteobacteria)]